VPFTIDKLVSNNQLMKEGEMTFRSALIFIFVFFIVRIHSYAGTGDWSQWRGPGRDGVAKTFPAYAKWPASFSPAWSIVVGAGHSSPVLIDDTVFVFSREAEEEVARAIHLTTGKVLWRSSYPAPYQEYPGAMQHGRGPKSTPALYDGKLFTLGISGILSCFSMSDGTLLWQKNFTGRFPATAPPFGTSMSPLIENGMLIVHAGGHDGGALLALDVNTGGEKWSLPGQGPSYSSPIVATFGNERQIVIQVHRKILGVDATDGRILWEIPFITPCDQNIVTPVVYQQTLIFSSLDHGIFAIRLKRQNHVWLPEKIWESKDVSLYMSSPVMFGNQLIGFSNKRQGQFFALDPQTGKLIWTSPARAAENAALVSTGKNLLILKEDAELLVLSASANSFSPIVTYQVAKSPTWAHPVLSDRGILIKDESRLTLLR
jgi:outer membrane protein assembly factor BamB